MKDELGRKIMRKFVGLRAKTYSYLIDDSSNIKQKAPENLKIIKTVQKQVNLSIK